VNVFPSECEDVLKLREGWILQTKYGSSEQPYIRGQELWEEQYEVGAMALIPNIEYIS